MANARASNVWDINATGALSAGKGQKVCHIIMTSTGANASLVLAESASGPVKFRAAIAATTTTQQFMFEVVPIFFSQDIYVVTLTNCVAQLVTTKGLEG